MAEIAGCDLCGAGLIAPAVGADSLVVTALGITLLLPVAVRVISGRFDPFEPVVVFAIAYGVMFVVRPVAMIARGALVHEGPRESLDVSSTFTEMLLLALVGGVGFVAGYLLPVGVRLARRHQEPRCPRDEKSLARAGVALGILGVAAFIVVFGSSGLGNELRSIVLLGNTELPSGSAANYATYLFLIVSSASLILLALGLKTRRVGLLLVGSTFGACFLAFLVPVGGRIALLPFVGGLLALYYLRRAERPSWVVLSGVAIFVLLSSAFLSDLRGRSTRDEGIVETVRRSSSPSRVLDRLLSGPDAEMAPTFAAALSVIPDRLPHTYGETVFGDFVTRPIPRGLWDGKPETPRRRLLAEVWPKEFANGSINAEFSTLVYFYWDFGILGVLLGLGFYGLLFRYLYEYFIRFHTTMYAQVLYSLALWFVVIGVRDGPVDTFVRAVFVLGPVWVAFALARRLPATGAIRPGEPE